MVILVNLDHLSLRLDRSNYAFWKSQVLPTVCAYVVDDFLLDNQPHPNAFIPNLVNLNFSINNLEHTTWVRLNQFLVSWFFSFISEPMLGHVVNCYISAKIWSTLE